MAGATVGDGRWGRLDRGTNPIHGTLVAHGRKRLPGRDTSRDFEPNTARLAQPDRLIKAAHAAILSLFKPAEAALAALELGDGFFKMRLAKVRPTDRGEVDLGVGDLPEKIIGDTQVTGGAD